MTLRGGDTHGVPCDFEPLRLVPRGKLVVLGLVTTKHGPLKSKDALKRRIEEAAHDY